MSDSGHSPTNAKAARRLREDASLETQKSSEPTARLPSGSPYQNPQVKTRRPAIPHFGCVVVLATSFLLCAGCSLLFLPDTIKTEVNCNEESTHRLVILSEPSNTSARENFAVGVEVENNGKLDPSYSQTITLRLIDPSSSSELQGTTSTQAVAGKAHFEELSINRSATGLQLEATADCAQSVRSNAFNIAPSAEAVKLAFLTQPHDIKAGDTFSNPIEVVALDESGRRDTDFSGRVNLRASQMDTFIYGRSAAFLASGSATFPNLAVLPGNRTDLQLLASTNGLKPGTSLKFDVLGTARYVDGREGIDTDNDCMDLTMPCQTPTHAALIAACGDTILIHGGIYLEPIQINRACAPNQPLKIRPWPQTGNPRIDTSGSSEDSIKIQGSSIMIQGLSVVGGNGIGIALLEPVENISVRACTVQNMGKEGIFLDTGEGHVIEDNEVVGSDLGGITVGRARQVQIRRNLVADSVEAGIHLRAGSHAIIQGNHLKGNNQGIQVFSSAEILNNRIHDCEKGIVTLLATGSIVNNTIVGNKTLGISITTGMGLDIRNNIIAHHKTGILDSIDHESTVEYNLFFENDIHCENFETTPCQNGIKGNITGRDPLFVDSPEGNENYYLSSPAGHYPAFEADASKMRSPGIDAADPDSDFSKESDENGQLRNLGAWGNTERASRSP